MDSITTGLRVLNGESTLVRKSDGTLVELEDLGSGGAVDAYSKDQTDFF